ncbi:MAG: glutamate--tRNA ligase [Candidatus Omnitrophica bacterium]|nr:glutamate--tRNA ligase [Candidatus Omnitrophota bacterium]
MIRVRFAPSPTGYLHLGNVRTALFNYLFAKANGGKFILRVEDTDKERSRKEYLESQKEDLLWMGLRWDEGPEVDGPYGPYLQSERLEIYRTHIQKLLDEGKAYYCYVTEQEVEEMKHLAKLERRPPHFDNRGRNFTQKEIEERKTRGVKPTVRFKIEHPELSLHDLVRGDVSFNLDEMVGDFVIQRADGMPTFHMAVVVDDAFMKITHIIRGEDHLSNTPKHILLQRALGFPTPQYGHLSLVHGPGGEPLSKRLSSVSVREFRKAGYLPYALCNYISLLGWAPPEGHEILKWDELIHEFDLMKVSKSSSNFDQDKLNWVNGEHLRLLSDQDFCRYAMTYLKIQGLLTKDEDKVHGILPIFKDNIQRFDQLPSRLEVLNDEFPYEEIHCLQTPEGREVVQAALEVLTVQAAQPALDYQAFIDGIKPKVKVKGKDLFHPLRMALTGKLNGPELKRIFPVLGMEKVKKRLEQAQKS